MRTFIALEVSEETRAALRAAERAMDGLPGVRWANPDTIHLTLKFLGEIKDNLAGEVIKVMERAARGVGPVEFAVRGLGWFPPGRRARVLWAGVKAGEGVLGTILRRLDEGLGELGIPSESRAYRPHVTIGRAGRPLDAEVVEGAFERVGEREFGTEVAGEMVLFMSELSPRGAVHTRMGAVALEGSDWEEG